MPASVDTLCVPPDRINEVWPHVAGWLSNAVGKCGDWTLKGIRAALDKEQAMLWIVWDGKLHAAGVTQLIVIPKGKICQVVACGGDQIIPWDIAFAPVEAYAKEQGCVAMRIEGRPGWKRIFADYTLDWVCLEKDLI